MAKKTNKKTNKRGMRQAPQRANNIIDTEAGVERIPSSTMINAGVDEIPSNTTITTPAAPAVRTNSAASATSGPNTTATTKKSATKKQKGADEKQASNTETTNRSTTNRPIAIRPVTNRQSTERPSTAASRARIPDFPEDDNLRGSIAMAAHRVYNREFQRLLDECEVRFKAFLEAEGPKPAMSKAWEDVREIGDKINNTVEDWVERWAHGQ